MSESELPTEEKLLQALHDSSLDLDIDPDELALVSGSITSAITTLCKNPKSRWKDYQRLQKKLTPEGLQMEANRAAKKTRNAENRKQYQSNIQ